MIDLITYTFKKFHKFNLNDENVFYILSLNSNISCLMLEYLNDKLICKIKECENKTEIKRSLFVFENIIYIIKKFNIQFKKKIYFFHYKEDCCNLNNMNIPLMAHSRKIGNENIILWPLTIKKYGNFLHHDLTYYHNNTDNVLWENKKNMFVFKGMNSGNPFSIVKNRWNLDRSSRVNLLLEYLKLPENLQKKGEISFDFIYPNTNEVKELLKDDKKILEKYKNNWLLGTIDELKDEINLLLKYIKPREKINYLYNFKYIICPEGFDVSSGLNWVLCSNSLAIVPPFHYENTIINSNFLKPYEHFVPINEDFSNLKETIEWCEMNEDKCKQIIKNANDYSKNFLDNKFMEDYLKEIIINIIKNQTD